MTEPARSSSAHYCEGFAPILSGKDRVLVLGTMPSVRSLADAFYYAHPRNAFWPIMADCLNEPGLAEASVSQKKQTLQAHGIALWDVLAACERPGSLDAAITSPEANDFEALFEIHSGIKQVLFNGQKAQQLFQRWVMRHQSLPDHLDYHVVPSTSPANARLSFENKRDFWCQTLSHIPVK
ncbi:DNA-deoxyinosine glycosylase [Thiomicrospira sp. WB1]|uniref:DNA-deoxyinosine glycosylase n=1 Tax=Thiomicrospira sp. WB1 TaxID=1685380 RepID=UPI00074A702F|nr:DNA-deoxyinosine glycosylase [Thiomicrospira sp. WB1]KUJ72126.1 DNA-deoxyinosine glycosylase [Thiomicrospira sp. WB1]